MEKEKDIFADMSALKPIGKVAIGLWPEGRIEISFSGAPLETLCYAHQNLGMAIQELIKNCAGQKKT